MLQRSTDPDGVRWLPGARLNIAECALGGRDPDAAAVLWASEGAPQDVRTVSLGQLRRRACRVAAALRGAGYQPGAFQGSRLYRKRVSILIISALYNSTTLEIEVETIASSLAERLVRAPHKAGVYEVASAGPHLVMRVLFLLKERGFRSNA